jgi:hypothetical protein
METFLIMNRKKEEKHGEYRAKRVILAIYDEINGKGDVRAERA